MEQQPKHSPNVQITDALFIGILTFLGYLIAYSYVERYQTYYQIPETFIDVSVPKILMVVHELLMTIGPLFLMILILPLSMFRKPNHPLFNTVLRFIWSLGISSTPFYFMRYNKYTLGLFVILVTVIIIYFFVFPLKFKVEGYMKKLEKRLEIENEKNSIVFLIDFLGGKLGKYSFLILLLLSLIPLAGHYGYKTAESKTDFLTLKLPKSTSYMVVLDTYKDFLIIAPLCKNSNIIEPRFQLVEQKADLDKSLEYTRKDVGQLIVAKCDNYLSR